MALRHHAHLSANHAERGLAFTAAGNATGHCRKRRRFMDACAPADPRTGAAVMVIESTVRAFRFAWLSVVRQPARALLGIAGVAAIGALLFDMLLLSRGLVLSFADLLDR